MAAPTILSSNNGNSTTNITDHSINMPASISAGDELYIVFVCDGNRTFTYTGWTLLKELVFLIGGTPLSRILLLHKTAAGSDTCTVVSSGTEMSAHYSFRMASTVEHIVSTGNAPNYSAPGTTTPDPDAVTISTSRDYLIMAICGYNDGSITVSAYPTDYGDNNTNIRANNSAGAGLGLATRTITTGSNQDPGTFTIDADNAAGALTVAFYDGGGASATATPSHVIVRDNVFAPTVYNEIYVTAAPALLTETITVYAPTAVAGITAATSLLTERVEIFAPTISGAAVVTLTPVQVTNQVFSPNIATTGSITITPDPVIMRTIIQAPTVSGSATATPGQLTATVSLYSPDITADALAGVDLVQITSRLHSPTVIAVTDVTASPGLLTITMSLNAPAIRAGLITIETLTMASTICQALGLTSTITQTRSISSAIT